MQNSQEIEIGPPSRLVKPSYFIEKENEENEVSEILCSLKDNSQEEPFYFCKVGPPRLVKPSYLAGKGSGTLNLSWCKVGLPPRHLIRKELKMRKTKTLNSFWCKVGPPF